VHRHATLKLPGTKISAGPVVDMLSFLGADQKVWSDGLQRKLMRAVLDRMSGHDSESLLGLLQKTFAYITVPGLQDIPIAILGKLDSTEMPDELVEECTKEEHYAHLPVEIRRRLWVKVSP